MDFPKRRGRWWRSTGELQEVDEALLAFSWCFWTGGLCWETLTLSALCLPGSPLSPWDPGDSFLKCRLLTNADVAQKTWRGFDPTPALLMRLPWSRYHGPMTRRTGIKVNGIFQVLRSKGPLWDFWIKYALFACCYVRFISVFHFFLKICILKQSIA